jgi:hypothetical protein
MMEYLEWRLRGSVEPADKERADIIQVIRQSRGVDIELPDGARLIKRNRALEEELLKLRRLLGIRKARKRIEHLESITGFGEALRHIRQSLKLNQTIFGDKAGLDQSMISKLEKETRTITPETLASICKAHNLASDQVRRLYSLAGLGYLLDPDPNPTDD